MNTKTRRNDSQATKDFWAKVQREDREADAKGEGKALIPCGWCDTPVIVDEDNGQIVYCSDDHAAANDYIEAKAL